MTRTSVMKEFKELMYSDNCSLQGFISYTKLIEKNMAQTQPNSSHAGNFFLIILQLESSYSGNAEKCSTKKKSQKKKQKKRNGNHRMFYFSNMCCSPTIKKWKRNLRQHLTNNSMQHVILQSRYLQSFFPVCFFTKLGFIISQCYMKDRT